MRLLTFAFFILLPFNTLGQDLKQYQWKNRLIILSGNTNNPKYIQQKKLLTNVEDDLIERNLIIIIANDYIRSQLHLNKKFEGILLIGKDGGIKFKETFVVKPETLFALIDTMPMRKAELSKTKG